MYIFNALKCSSENNIQIQNLFITSVALVAVELLAWYYFSQDRRFVPLFMTEPAAAESEHLNLGLLVGCSTNCAAATSPLENS